ncbi:MAG: ribosome maturation factor RimP [Candidatus Omnitrophica bacterium]|nr:ribosome maturation factor RimP [Candidatus Omnitrophota bacterium]
MSILYSGMLEPVKNLLTSLLEEEGLCLVEARIHPAGRRLILKLFIDKPHGGITLNECARLNDKLGELIEKEGIINQAYILEVSSPGIDRPLINKEDFNRCLQQKVRIFLNECRDKKYEVSGKVITVNDNTVNIDSEGQIHEISFDNVRKGKQIIEELK